MLGQMGEGVNTAGTALGTLGNLGNAYQTMDQNLQSQLMAPMGQYANYQSVINPLQEAQAQMLQSQPTGFQQVMGAIGGGLNALVSGAGVPFSTAANAFGNPMAGQYSYGTPGMSSVGGFGNLSQTLGPMFGGGNNVSSASGGNNVTSGFAGLPNIAQLTQLLGGFGF